MEVLTAGFWFLCFIFLFGHAQLGKYPKNDFQAHSIELENPDIIQELFSCQFENLDSFNLKSIF